METLCSTPQFSINRIKAESKFFENVNFSTSRKIYILRHEERFDNISFTTHLTPKGLYNAENKICPLLEQLNISNIYCSPFTRTLETIKPFCDKTRRKVNVEWSLVESLPYNPTISHKFASIINPNYTSHTPYSHPSTSNILSFKDLVSRVSSFLNSTNDRNNDILLVTHMPVINAIFRSKGLTQYTVDTYHAPGSLSYVQRI